jgi:hypothetical protein
VFAVILHLKNSGTSKSKFVCHFSIFFALWCTCMKVTTTKVSCQKDNISPGIFFGLKKIILFQYSTCSSDNVTRFYFLNHISGIMVNVFTSGAVDRGFESRSGNSIKWVFVASPLRRKYKNWLAQNQGEREREQERDFCLVFSLY